jgi:hypothetical protein
MDQNNNEEPKKSPSPLSPESKGLDPLVGENVVIGYDEDINGPGARLVDFQPTRAEMKLLGLHYLNMYYDALIWCETHGMSGSSEWRELRYSSDRFFAIAEAIDPDTMPAEFQPVIAEGNRRLREISS